MRDADVFLERPTATLLLDRSGEHQRLVIGAIAASLIQPAATFGRDPALCRREPATQKRTAGLRPNWEGTVRPIGMGLFDPAVTVVAGGSWSKSGE